jgi:hypothetical protein
MATIAYSPGVCPVGYTTGNLVIHNPVTTAQCCPSYVTLSTTYTATPQLTNPKQLQLHDHLRGRRLHIRRMHKHVPNG